MTEREPMEIWSRISEFFSLILAYASDFGYSGTLEISNKKSGATFCTDKVEASTIGHFAYYCHLFGAGFCAP